MAYIAMQQSIEGPPFLEPKGQRLADYLQAKIQKKLPCALQKVLMVGLILFIRVPRIVNFLI